MIVKIKILVCLRKGFIVKKSFDEWGLYRNKKRKTIFL